MLDPTIINRDSTPADVLAAMLPVVREAFREKWKIGRGHDPFGFDAALNTFGANETWVMIFASHVLPPLMEIEAMRASAPNDLPTWCALFEKLDAALTAFRDAWCAAAENQSKETN